MKKEINRRLKILEKKKVPTITARMLRGGMQERLNRQENIRYGKEIETEKKKLNNKLSSLIQQERRQVLNRGFGIMSASSVEPLDDFNEPVFRKIRNRRGFF